MRSLQLEIALLITSTRPRPRQRIERSVAGNDPQLRDRGPIHTGTTAAAPTVVSPRTNCIQISYFSCGAKNRFPFLPGCVLIKASSGTDKNPPMRANTNRDQRHELRHNTWVRRVRFVTGG